MALETIVIIGIFFFFALLEFVRGNLFNKSGQTKDDAIVELVGAPTLLLLTQPLILFTSAYLMGLAFPQHAGALANIPLLAQIGLLLVLDDMTQYWWHRLSHSVKWLYALHRPHHDAAYMSIRVVYRNNVFYYLLMPGIWFSGALIYLGLAPVYAVYLMIKLLVICGAHTDIPWDRSLYKIKWLSPVMWIIERTISTPSTHHAHHGKHADDKGTHYKGNYGNLLFFWDVLFGTAVITRTYPKAVGVEGLAPISAAQQLFWPLVPTTKAQRQLTESPEAD